MSSLPPTLPAAHELIVDLLGRLQQAQWQVAQLKKQLFGPSSERAPQTETLSKEQILLSLFAAASEPAATANVTIPAAQQERQPRTPRQPVARVLETLTQRIEPQEKVCPHCGKDKCLIGCETSERFEYVPAKIIRHEIVRPKLACPCGEGTVSIAPLPPSPIQKGQAGPGLLAHVMLSKYDDHLPLYRQQKQLERLGVYFPRQTLCDWIEHGAQWLQPLVRQMKQDLVAGDYVQVDETPVRVMDPEVPGKCATGWLWVMGRPGGDVIFEFHPGRGKVFAEQLIGDFRGYLQRDGYGVYGALASQRPGLIGVGCWSHARRKFVEALEENPSEAGPIVTEIRKLYLIERRARDEAMGAQQRHALRQQTAAPILSALKVRLEHTAARCLPQSPTGKAIRYALGEWETLTAVDDGLLDFAAGCDEDGDAEKNRTCENSQLLLPSKSVHRLSLSGSESKTVMCVTCHRILVLKEHKSRCHSQRRLDGLFGSTSPEFQTRAMWRAWKH